MPADTAGISTMRSPHSRNILQKVMQTISRHDMFSKGDGILTCVSGGSDSVALLHILLQLAPIWELKIGIAHLNHCLRGAESQKDADFVLDLASRLNLPCYCESANLRNDPALKKLSLEAAARKVRYDFFERVRRCNGYQKIAMGHQKDDNAELMLMFLFRGSGISGFSGIPPVRAGGIVRPLISTGRNELVAFLDENEITYRVDESNRDMRFLRNRIRHETIPHIQVCCNPGIVDTLNRFSRITRSEDQWVNDIIQPMYEKALIGNDPFQVVLAISILTAFPEAVRRRVIRTAICRIKGNLLRISFSHIEAVRELTERRQGLYRLMLPDGIHVERNKDALIFYQADASMHNRGPGIQPGPQPFCYAISGSSECIVISETGQEVTFSEIPMTCMVDNLSEKIALLDLERLTFPLMLRNVRPGDRFSPLGVTGTQKIQKFFIDHKIERSQRQRCPVLLSGNEVAWLAGHRISNRFKVTPLTRRVLRIEICSGSCITCFDD